MLDSRSNHRKNVAHGFFLSIATTIAEPSTILPLIIHYFGGSSLVVGLFSSLLRGGAIAIQLYAAFHAQAYPKMIIYLRRVFFVRFITWFMIGLIITIFGKDYPTFTLYSIGVGFFIFSFSAGFGGIYFKELSAKIFTHKFRGYTMSHRQFFTAFGSIISGVVAGWVLDTYEAPMSFGYLFMISAIIMSIGFIIFGTVDEPIKSDLSEKESSFILFLKNTIKILKADKRLQLQVITFLLAYSYLLGLPFIIIDATQSIHLSGMMIGQIITAQMIGAMLSNILWAKMSAKGIYKTITLLSISIAIFSFLLSIFAENFYTYLFIFFLIGGAMDGGKIASGNLILIIAPTKQRAVYSAIQSNITSLGLFFSIIGGIILINYSYDILYLLTIFTLTISLALATKLTDHPS